MSIDPDHQNKLSVGFQNFVHALVVKTVNRFSSNVAQTFIPAIAWMFVGQNNPLMFPPQPFIRRVGVRFFTECLAFVSLH